MKKIGIPNTISNVLLLIKDKNTNKPLTIKFQIRLKELLIFQMINLPPKLDLQKAQHSLQLKRQPDLLLVMIIMEHNLTKLDNSVLSLDNLVKVIFPIFRIILELQTEVTKKKKRLPKNSQVIFMTLRSIKSCPQMRQTEKKNLKINQEEIHKMQFWMVRSKNMIRQPEKYKEISRKNKHNKNREKLELRQEN